MVLLECQSINQDKFEGRCTTLSWWNHPKTQWLALGKVHVSRLGSFCLQTGKLQYGYWARLSFQCHLDEFWYCFAGWCGKGLSRSNWVFLSSFSAREQCWHYSQDHRGVPLQGRQQLWLRAERLVASPVKNKEGTSTGRGNLGRGKRKVRRWMS